MHFDKRLRDNCIRTNKKPGLDSRGSSLIEVIVAMLVLALIILPMLDMFASAGRTNAKARSRQYANSVLENVLEELSAGNYEPIYEVADAKNSPARDLATNRLKLYYALPDDKVLSGKSYLTGLIQQGTKEYQAEISFDAQPYREGTSALNTYGMPDINSYDTGNSELLLLDSTNDDFAVSVFYDEYKNQGEAEYQRRLSDAWLASDAYLYNRDPLAWYEKWKEEHPDKEPTEADRPVFNEAGVDRFYAVDESVFRTYVRRDTFVEIADAGEGEYIIRYTVTYSVNVAAGTLDLDSAFTPVAQVYETSSGSRYKAEDLKYIYIFYEPFSGSMDTESLMLEATEISKQAQWNCRLYLAVQEGAVTGKLRFYLTMDNGLTADEREARLKILSADALDSPGVNYTAELVPTRAPEDKVYRVTVRVMEAETGELVAEADTTLYHE